MSTLATKILVIMLHGVGSNGGDLAPLADSWKDALPNAVFASPDAPTRSSFGSGYQWFSVAGVTEQNRSSRIVEARSSFDAVISAIIDQNGFSQNLDHIAFIGFSQGTIMALDAVSSGRWPVGAVVGFSGRLASPLPLTPSTSTAVLLIHGAADPVIPASETTEAAAVLRQLGMEVETVIQPGMPHTISAQGALKAGEFLADTFSK
jgi:phospholipase/carboxylesterase